MWLLLFLLWLIILPLSIQLVAEKLSLLGVYHTVSLKGDIWKKLNLERNGSEKFSDKVMKVYWCNFYLTLVFMPAYYMVIYDIVELRMSLFNVFCLSYILTLVSLITIRLLSNQPRVLAIRILELYPINQWESLQEKHNEKTITHFHILICTALMILGILVSTSIITGEDLHLIGVLPQTSEIESYAFAFCIYTLVLFACTVCVEIFLFFFRPVVQIQKAEEESLFNQPSLPKTTTPKTT